MTTERGRHSQFDIALGNRLRQLRLDRNMTQEQMGEMLGVSFQQVQKYEKGLNAIASSRMEALCKALDITPDQLFEINAHGAKHIASLSNYAVRTAQRLDKLDARKKQIISLMLTSWGVEDDE